MFSGDGGQLLSDKSLTGSAGGGNNRMKFNILPLAFFIGIIVSPARAELYFNPRFLSDDPDAVADLSAFTQGQELPPGVYRVDIYLNDTYISTRDVFGGDNAHNAILLCLPRMNDYALHHAVNGATG